MSSATDKYQPVRTIRLPVEQIARILDELDTAANGATAMRRDSRYRYRLNEIVVLMQQPGHSAPMAFIVPTRNISARGLAFLHGGFVHPGTVVVVQLVTTRGAAQNVVGMVRRCRYIQSNVHEVAIQFKSTVDPAVFCHDAVRIRVLLAEHDAALARLAQLHLGRLNCEVEAAPDGNQVVQLALSNGFDLILMNMELPGLDGFAVARELRDRGFTGLVVGCTGSDTAAEQKKCLESGCDQHMVRPFTFEQLVTCIGSLQCAPLFSTFHDDPVMADLVSEFVSGIVGKIRGLEEALDARDNGTLGRMAANLKAESRAFGFEMITDAAAAVERAARNGDSPETIARLVRALIRLCSQARAAPKKSG